MAYVDMLAQNSYGQYNRCIASKLGLKTAVYISELMNILLAVKEKNKYDEDGFWKLDRKKLETLTTLSLKEQTEIESILTALNILEVKEKDMIRCRAENIFKLVLEDVELPAEITKITKKKSTKLTKETIIGNLKDYIDTLEPDKEIAEMLKVWIEIVYNKGLCKKVQVKGFIDDLNRLAMNRQDKINAIHTATQNAWKDANWCFKRSVNKSGVVNLGTQKISTGEVDKTNQF